MRSLAPAETLVYLETNDLAAALQPIVDSKPFNEVAKSKPDFSALKGVQLAVAVTGFETPKKSSPTNTRSAASSRILSPSPTRTHGIFRRSVLPNKSSVHLSTISTTASRRSKSPKKTAGDISPGPPRTAARPTRSSSTASSISATTNRHRQMPRRQTRRSRQHRQNRQSRARRPDNPRLRLRLDRRHRPDRQHRRPKIRLRSRRRLRGPIRHRRHPAAAFAKLDHRN